MRIVNSLNFVVLAAIVCLPADAALIVNGGFESGLSGWSTADQVGSDGSFGIQTGTMSPRTSTPVPAPPGGTTAAMSDAEGPGSHLLFQVFTATAPVAVMRLDFDVFVGNRSDAFRTPDTLDFSTPTLNQQARVDILMASSDPFSVAAGDVLLNAFQTAIGTPLVTGYQHVSVDVTSVLNSHLNSPLMLRFAEVDNVNLFQLGVDNVDFVAAAPVPEPASFAVAFSGIAALVVVRRLRH